VECKKKNGTGNGRDNWNNLKIFQKIPAQHTCEARHEGTTENFVKLPYKSKIYYLEKEHSLHYKMRAVVQLVEEPSYQRGSREFDSQLCQWNFSLT
jgi:hypothetical protein